MSWGPASVIGMDIPSSTFLNRLNTPVTLRAWQIGCVIAAAVGVCWFGGYYVGQRRERQETERRAAEITRILLADFQRPPGGPSIPVAPDESAAAREFREELEKANRQRAEEEQRRKAEELRRRSIVGARR